MPEEAETVRRIYRAYLEGKSPSYIARQLSASGIPSPSGKANWRPETVKSILTNEKYKGDAVLQKTFCTDFLTKKFKANEGEVPQYYVENSHPAIIEPEVFDMVQAEIRRRGQSGRRYYTPHCFSGRIFCDECGSVYGSKVWNSGSKYRSQVWQCNGKHYGGQHCSTPPIRTETLEEAFVLAVNRVLGSKDEIIAVCETVMAERCEVETLNEENARLQAELEVTTGLMERLIAANAAMAQDQAEYNRQFAEYETRYNMLREKIAEVEAERARRIAQRGMLNEYLATLRAQGPITSFDETLWYGTVEQVRVKADNRLCFIFKDGKEIEI